MKLKGKKVAIIADTGSHDHEFWFPYYRFLEGGANVYVAGPKKGQVLGEGPNGKDGLPINIDFTVEEILENELDILFLPGGIYGPLALRIHEPTLNLVKSCYRKGVLVCAICHAPWILISAGIVEGKRIACPSDMAIDIKNAGGIYCEEPAVTDCNLITSVYFGYLPEMFQAISAYYSERTLKRIKRQ